MENYEDYTLPNWVTGRSNEPVVGSQLCTRDGRKTGNACIIAVCEDRNEAVLFCVLTDAGNLLSLYRYEIEELFHVPEYTMNPDTCPGILSSFNKLWR